MSLDRRKFIGVSSLALAGMSLLNKNGFASVFEYAEKSDIDQLRQNFLNPPDATKSSCYWWWFNGLVDKEGITRDLEEFRKKGMGEVLLINTSGGLGGVPFPQGAIFMSDEWKGLYRHAMSEAKRLSIGVGINLTSGWCMGGPWIKPEDSGRWYLQSETPVSGPKKYAEKLPLPGNRVGYDSVFNPPGYKKYIDLPLSELDYRDTSIVAIPDIPQSKISGERSWVLNAKVNRKDASNSSLATNIMGPVRYQWKNKVEDIAIPLDRIIDLTDHIKKDGTLEWEVPAGNWKIVRTGHRMTGSRLMIAQPEADGLSVDWFDKKGVDIQFANLGRMFLEEAAKVGNKPKYFHDDSFEDGFPNWTDKIVEKFEHYRGYSPKPYMPVLTGYIVESAEISDRFLNDYRKTLADLMADEHYRHFADLCHREGILVQNESAGPSRSGTVCIDGLKNLGRSDFPMGEFWLGPNHQDESTLTDDKAYGVSRLDKGQNKVTKMVASAAHLYGKKTVSAEAFTTMTHWKDYPGSLKQSLDRAFCEGVNRITIHTSTSQRPKDGKPGYEYGAGTHFNPNVTWWEKSAPFFEYVARSQYLLRAGLFHADVLFYNGDIAPNLVEQKHVNPSLGKGYDYDVCNEEILLTRLSVKDKRLCLPDGMTYRVLVLPDDDRMPLEVAEKIKKLVDGGATVIGPKPAKATGLTNYPECDRKLSIVASELWGKTDGISRKLNRHGLGRVFCGEKIRNVLIHDGVLPDFEHTGSEDVFIDFIHRTTKNAEVYFITNRHGKALLSHCTFRNRGVPQIWDPVNGKIIEKVAYSTEKGRVTLPLKFAEFQSYFVVFDKTAITSMRAAKNYPDLQLLQTLSRPWTVKFDSKWGGPEETEFPKLIDWSESDDDRIKYYSGKGIYTNTFMLTRINQPLYLHLGEVKDIAEVFLNGKNLGIVWTAPWQLEISHAVQKGVNELKVEVINQWPNRLIGDAALPKEKRLTNTNIAFKKTDKLLPSGLLGPVKILIGKE